MTFLEGQNYPLVYPMDPTRMLWASYIDIDGSGRKREVMSILPVDIQPPFNEEISYEQTYDFLKAYPILVMPIEFDLIRLSEFDDHWRQEQT